MVYWWEKDIAEGNIKTLAEAFWFGIVTLTTVGYGDYYPVSGIGKIFGLFFILGSIGVIGFFISQLTTQISIILERKKLGYSGTDFKGHIIIIGWDKFAHQVTDEVINSGKQVAIITNNRNDIDLIYEAFPEDKVFALFTDYSNIDGFVKVNINYAANVFINFHDDAETLIYVLNLQKKYENLNYVVSLNNPSLKETFFTAGVRYIVSKNEIASRMVASYTFEPDVADISEAMMTTALEGDDYDLHEYKVNKNNPFLGQDYLDAFISLKVDYDSILIGISKHNGERRKLLTNPGKGTLIAENDYLVLMSSGASKNMIEELFGVEEGRMSN